MIFIGRVFIPGKIPMKVWPADWRKSVFFQPSNASSSSTSERKDKSGDASDKSSSLEFTRESGSKNSGSEASKSPTWLRTAEPVGCNSRGSVDHENIERARRDSTTYLQSGRDSMESNASTTEMMEDIVSIRIPVEGQVTTMYSEPRHIVHAGMFDLVHASMWLWQEKSQRVLWANRSANEAHQVTPTQRISMSSSLEFSCFRKAKNAKGNFISNKLREVEDGCCMLYLKGLAVHILPHILSNRRSEEETDIVEVVLKPYVLRGLYNAGDERCCLVEIVNSLSKESARDVEMFQANTGKQFFGRPDRSIVVYQAFFAGVSRASNT